MVNGTASSEVYNLLPTKDSFVEDHNKVRSANGERALHLGSKNDHDVINFFGPFGTPMTFRLGRTELLQFLNQIRPEYEFPNQPYGLERLGHRSPMSELWSQRLKKVAALPDIVDIAIEATTSKSTDDPRYYVRSDDPCWDLLREILLPAITRIGFEKITEHGATILEMRLNTVDTLVDRLMWRAEDVNDALATLSGSLPQIILAGPPGTGKSWAAKQLAGRIAEDRDGTVEFVQFHPSYGYEDFVFGIRPVASATGVSFEEKPGIMMRFSDLARSSEDRHVIIIDEMNRANIPRVLGELMYLLEYRDESMTLQHGERYALPANLSIIATMNTSDRSIQNLDVALRRRFEVFECQPSADALGRYFSREEHHCSVPDLVEGFTSMNTDLGEQIDRHHTIGHTFFMRPDLSSETLHRVWKRQVRPLLEEYFFDAPDLADSFTVEKYWPSAKTAS